MKRRLSGVNGKAADRAEFSGGAFPDDVTVFQTSFPASSVSGAQFAEGIPIHYQ
jgi:hypothetical protein